MQLQYQLETIANYHCEIGENPLWDEAQQLLYWTDILRGRLFRYRPMTGQHEQFYQGEPVSGFTLQADGSLLLFGENTYFQLMSDGTIEEIESCIDPRMKAFNDAIATPNGTVFVGSSAEDTPDGGLFYLALDGAFTLLFRGTTNSNGLGFSPDVETFYWTDSPGRTIYQFDYDLATDQLSHRREFIVTPEGDGVPDGLTVDRAGNIWSARFGGGAVYVYSPAGELLDKIKLPVPQVSSVAFGGPDLDELYVTTSGGTDESTGPEGALFRIRGLARGRPEFRSRIKLEMD